MAIEFVFEQAPPKRQCDSCTLCCKLLPVKDLDKRAGERCQYQTTKGCMVHHKAGMPHCCAIWNCRWLVNDDTADLRRPDRSHYVIDIMPDVITARNNQSGERHAMEVVQVWVDADYPDAWRDPELLAFLDRRGEDGLAALIRYGNVNGFLLFPPSITNDGQWHEIHDGVTGVERSTEEMHQLISETRGGKPPKGE